MFFNCIQACIRYSFSVLIFFYVLSAASARDVTITVEDADFALPLEGALLTLRDGSVIQCDNQGRAVITVPDKESASIQVSYPGYTGVTARISAGEAFITVALTIPYDALLENKELVFEARSRFSETGEAGRSVALPEEQRNIASEIGLAEDVMSSVKLLPGVGYAGMFNAQPSLRGGDPGDLVAILDGFYIKKPYHWDGGFSIFAPQMVETAVISHGVFSARYGWTVSGILDVVSNKPPPDYATLEVNVSTNTFDAALSFSAGGGGAALFGRYSYWDSYFALAKRLAGFTPLLEPAEAITKAPFINSAAFSAYYDWTPYFRTIFNGYAGHDGVVVNYDPYDAMAQLIYKAETGLYYDWSNIISFINAGFTITPASSMMIKAALGAGYDALVVTHESKSNKGDGWKDKREEPHFNMQFDLDYEWQIDDAVILSAGVEELPQQWRTQRHGKKGHIDWEYAPGQRRQVFAYYPDIDNRAYFSSFWSTVEWMPAGKRYSAELGVRFDHIYLITDGIGVNAPVAANPRFNISCELLSNAYNIESLTLAAGSGFFSSMNDAVTLENSKTGLLSFEQTKSWTSIIAVKADFFGGVGIDIEAYYKRITNHPYSTFSLLDNDTAWYVYYFDGYGRIFGVDVMLKKFGGRFLSGWLSYSFNDARYNNPQGTYAYRGSNFAAGSDKWYYPEYHRFHTINLVVNCNFNGRVGLHTRLGFASGAPEPEYLSHAYRVLNMGGDYSVRYSNDSLYSDNRRNTFSMPLDVKLSYYFYKRDGRTQAEFYAAGENVLVFFLPKVESILFRSGTGEFYEGRSKAIYDVQIPMASFGLKWSY
ncbi:MAG: TonB-dependent receptor plug domain-containing protein [Spirochaetaceae bacterium]|jgi:hypothetical protein|nr:TonB-dependent receptor plug domain-containing protein [Spirochaetaceae bacterium]